MKFANISFSARGVNNIGDNMQLIAIDNIYKEMGISQSEIVYIDFHHLADYDGEYVILPLSMPMVDYVENGIAGRFSQHIIPVFLGLNMVRQFLHPAEVSYLKMYEPIGCRDEWMLETCRKYNIASYLHGCITFTLPERKKNDHQNKVYIVDAAENLVKMLPASLFSGKEIIYKTHNYHELTEDPKEKALAQYQEYKENAALVITGLLHCALPCFAAGIPVIMLNTQVSYRKAFLESLLPIWTPEKLNAIQMSRGGVQPSVLSGKQKEFKKALLDVTKKRIWEAYEKNAPLYDISFFYEERERSVYINDAAHYFIEWIKENCLDKTAVYTFSIWGLTQISEYVCDFIKRHLPNAHLVAVYDAFKDVSFMGLKSHSPETLTKESRGIVFVTAAGAVPSAREKERELKNSDLQFVYRTLVK